MSEALQTPEMHLEAIDVILTNLADFMNSQELDKAYTRINDLPAGMFGVRRMGPLTEQRIMVQLNADRTSVYEIQTINRDQDGSLPGSDAKLGLYFTRSRYIVTDNGSVSHGERRSRHTYMPTPQTVALSIEEMTKLGAEDTAKFKYGLQANLEALHPHKKRGLLKGVLGIMGHRT